MLRVVKFVAGSLLGLILLLGLCAWLYVRSLDLDQEAKPNKLASESDLGFAPAPSHMPQPIRGRILAVVTSADTLLDGSKTGYELTELSRAWWVFTANDFAVDIASPNGGVAPMRLDDDLIDADYAFLNDPRARVQLRNTRKLSELDPTDYQAVYLVGGKGAMVDFYRNTELARILRGVAQTGVIGAVCHGPAALLDVRLNNGQLLLAGKQTTGFSNAEELFLMKNPAQRLGFMLEDQLALQSSYRAGPMYLEHVISDGNLITGQNPWSSWGVANAMLKALGSELRPRQVTAEERSVTLLQLYHAEGLTAAIAAKQRGTRSDKRLLLMHAFVAASNGQWRHAWAIEKLARA